MFKVFMLMAADEEYDNDDDNDYNGYNNDDYSDDNCYANNNM